VGRSWPKETKKACLLALQAGSDDLEVSKRFKVPAGTVRRWASEHKIPIVSERPARPRPGTVKAEDVPADIRAKLKASVANTTERMSDTEIEARDFAQLARGLKDLMGLVPDLLSYEAKLDPERADDTPARRGRVLELAERRGLGRRRADVPGEPGGAEPDSAE
jgi:hypothetical protein